MKTAVTLLVTSTALFRTRAPWVQTLAIFPHPGPRPGTPGDGRRPRRPQAAAGPRTPYAKTPSIDRRRPQAARKVSLETHGRDKLRAPKEADETIPPVRTLEARPGQTPGSRTSRTMDGNRTASSRRRPGHPGKEPPTTQDGVPDTDRSHPRHKSGRHRRRSRNRRRGGTEGRRDPLRPRARPEPAFSNTFNNTGRRGHCGSPGTSSRRHGKGQNRRTGTLPRESHAEDAREGGAPRCNPGRTRGRRADRLAARPLTGNPAVFRRKYRSDPGWTPTSTKPLPETNRRNGKAIPGRTRLNKTEFQSPRVWIDPLPGNVSETPTTAGTAPGEDPGAFSLGSGRGGAHTGRPPLLPPFILGKTAASTLFILGKGRWAVRGEARFNSKERAPIADGEVRLGGRPANGNGTARSAPARRRGEGPKPGIEWGAWPLRGAPFSHSRKNRKKYRERKT